MTPSQRARLIGFNASLKQRGVALSLVGPGSTHLGLIEPVEPDDADRYNLNPHVRDEAKLSFLRETASGIGIGAALTHPDGHSTYRVQSILSRPSDFVVTLRCEAFSI